MVKRCLILGSANCLRKDLALALSLGEYEGVVAAKGAGLEWNGDLTAWVSLHPDRFPGDIKRRREMGWPDAERTYGHKEFPGVSHWLPYKWPNQKRSGSSGLFALRVAIEEFGFDRCVLCGIPLEKREGRLDGKTHWNGANSFKQGFIEAMPYIKSKARSCSGWTRMHLGVPTLEWLQD